MSVQAEKPVELLPLFYKDQFDKDVYWICDKDEHGKIVSIFLGHGDRFTAYMNSDADVLSQEAMLKEKGWVKCRRPNVSVTFDEKKMPRILKRKEQRRKDKEEKKEKIRTARLAMAATANPSVNLVEVEEKLKLQEAEEGSSSSDSE